MKYRNLLLIIFLGTILFPTNSFGDGAQNISKSEIASPLPGAHHEALDYISQNEIDIRAHISAILPGTYLDSMNIVIRLMSDSIRNKLSKTNDSVTYYKACLNNLLQDSVLLNGLSILMKQGEEVQLDFNDVITVHCVDISSSLGIDSVKMDLFSGNKLIASAISDKQGMINIHNIPRGDYSVVFSRRAYVRILLKHFKYAATGQAYIDIPLSKQPDFLMQTLSKNIWLFVTAAGVLVIFSLAVLIYALTRNRSMKK